MIEYYMDEHIYAMRDAVTRLGSFASITSDLKLLNVSPSFTEMLGYTTEDLEGKSLQYLGFSAPDAAELHGMLPHIHRGGTWVGDFFASHKDGTPVDVRLSIAPSISGGMIVGYVAQFQKSYVRRSPFSIDEVMHRYRSGFNKVSAMALVTSAGVVIDVNELFVEMFGYTQAQIVGMDIAMLSRSKEHSAIPDNVWDVVSNGQVYTGEVDHIDINGRTVYTRMTVAPSTSTHSDTLASFDLFLLIYQDITAEVEMRMNQQELAVEAAKQQMLSGAIHNISNLQQGVLASNARVMIGVQGLESAFQLGADHYATLETVEEKSDFLTGMKNIMQASVTQIVKDVGEERRAIDETVAVLHSFRRAQKNIRTVSDESISAIVQGILNTFSLRAAQQHVAVFIRQMADASVRWPTAQIHQIIFNLLINAQQAIAECVSKGNLAEHRGLIELAINLVDDDVLVSVKDNGGGFNVCVAQLFTPRFTTKEAGSGIGLHTSAIMAQSMGGTLTAENIEMGKNRGAQFTLRVPRMIEAKGTD